jgi:inorganic pyrophosphatase
MAPELDVVIEVPRGSFLKRGSTGRLDFVSPLPCPYNYGSVPQYLGLEGDLLDALVLGPPLAARHARPGERPGVRSRCAIGE